MAPKPPFQGSEDQCHFAGPGLWIQDVRLEKRVYPQSPRPQKPQAPCPQIRNPVSPKPLNHKPEALNPKILNPKAYNPKTPKPPSLPSPSLPYNLNSKPLNPFSPKPKARSSSGREGASSSRGAGPEPGSCRGICKKLRVLGVWGF